jgi:hypothetical protein
MRLGRLQLFHYGKQILRWAPAPLFLAGFVWSLFPSLDYCGGRDWSMPVMWLLMSFAHLLPYVQLWEVCGCPKGCGCHRKL